MKHPIYHLYISINFANNTVDYQQSERISPESMNGYRPEYAIISLHFLLLKENESVSHHKMIERIVIGNLLQREIRVKNIAYLQ